MEGRESSDPGYDDWFDEPEPPTQDPGRSARGVYDDDDEVWVLPDDEERPRARGAGAGIVVGGRTFSTTQAAVIVAALVAVLIAGLAAGGVFSSGKPAVTTINTPTTPPPTHQTSTQTVTTPSAQAPTVQLSPGASGKDVKTLQRALTALGFSPGKADGFYGTATETAVKQFQSANHLTADGVVGPATLAALQQALSG